MMRTGQVRFVPAFCAALMATRTASSDALRHTAWISAPLNPSVWAASSSARTSSRQGLAAQPDLENLPASVAVRRRNLQQDIEPARPQERRVDQVRAVRRREDEHSLQFLDAVHLREELADHALRHVRIRRRRSRAPGPARQSRRRTGCTPPPAAPCGRPRGRPSPIRRRTSRAAPAPSPR